MLLRSRRDQIIKIKCTKCIKSLSKPENTLVMMLMKKEKKIMEKSTETERKKWKDSMQESRKTNRIEIIFNAANERKGHGKEAIFMCHVNFGRR